MDPIVETIIEILGIEVARRVLGPEDETPQGPEDGPFRQVPAFPETMTLRHCICGVPWDIVDAAAEDRYFDYLLED